MPVFRCCGRVLPRLFMNSSDYPTLWQRRTMWSALTALALATIGGIAVGLVWTAAQVISFLIETCFGGLQ